MVLSSLSNRLMPFPQAIGQGCDEAFESEAPIRSLPAWSMANRDHLEIESTNHMKGILPVPLWVKLDPRSSSSHYRSPIIADDLQP